MKKVFIFGLLSAIVLLAACKKDKNGSNASIEGTYKLKYISAKTSSSVIGNYGDKTVTTSEYTTTNNQGTITLSNGALTATGLTYSVDTRANLYEYFGTDLLDSSSYPFSFTLPASNSASQYQLIGADSIYFPQGGITSGADGSGYQSIANGGHYSFSGNLLTITEVVSKDSTYGESGETYKLIEGGTSSVVLEKQ